MLASFNKRAVPAQHLSASRTTPVVGSVRSAPTPSSIRHQHEGQGTLTTQRRRTTLVAASAALATLGLLVLRSRRAATSTSAHAHAHPHAHAPAHTPAADLARWRALFPFRPRAYVRATWRVSRQRWALPPHRAALSSFAALRASHAFFREQDPARAQLWLARHHDLRQTPAGGGADSLARASAELRCWSALQALASGAPDDFAHAALRTFLTLDGASAAPDDDHRTAHAAHIIDAVRSASSVTRTSPPRGSR